ncbi:MAG: PepSY domain-containing protein [Hydrococcus sp. RU_2_2]|nr:PepSY domain-containing protein [Hydrococcus sp. RU_2_2]
MGTKRLRDILFFVHRYLGLGFGLILILIGITGSLLVFHHEIEDWLISQRYEIVVPQGQPISVDKAVEIAKSAYPSWQIDELSLPKDNRHPLMLGFVAPDVNPNLYEHGFYKVLVNPYTGEVMGNFATRFTFYRFLLNLHYRLFLPGEWAGRIVTGITALFLLITAMTGVILWPGWRKLTTGFKIKWNAHIKRLNFDIHKVVGILAAVFLIFTAFTGIYLNFYDWMNPAIYALTASTETESKLPTISDPKPGQTPILPSVAIATAQKALPNVQIESIYFVTSKNQPSPFEIYGKSGEIVYLDPYTAQVLKIEAPQQIKASLGDRISEFLFTLHFGTFWGIPSRILYIFVGLSPLILFITGLVMWGYRLMRNLKRDRANHE